MAMSVIVLVGLAAAQTTAPQCQADTGSMLALDIETFDQSKNGWRKLADTPGCEKTAADLIAAYRNKVEGFLPLLSWHQGQLLALIGDYRAAIPLLESARDRGARSAGNGWDDYVDATVAFLKNDSAGVAEAEKKLAARRRPADWPAGREWPMNFRIVQSLGRCIGKPYREAYSPDCGIK